jgi:acetyltransferase-like isoleucine patch superfamily enzyme
MTTPDPVPPLLSLEALRLATHTPWKVANELRRLALLPVARLYFALMGVAWAPGLKLYGLPILQRYRPSTLRLGRRAELRSTPRSNSLAPHHAVVLTTRRQQSVLIIGDDFGMTGGVICAEERVTIGDRVTIGANCTLTDTDFHPLDPAERRRSPLAGRTAPIVVEDDVFIGMGCMVLKGVTLGAGSVIGAGSVVTRSIPAGVIAAGNPARVIRAVRGESRAEC